jgi:translocation and assembly module TamB
MCAFRASRAPFRPPSSCSNCSSATHTGPGSPRSASRCTGRRLRSSHGMSRSKVSSLDGLTIERAPVSEPSKKGSSTHLPHIDVGRLSIGALELSPELTGVRATLAVQGSAHLISLENAAAHITARRTDGQGGDYALTLRFDPARMDATVKLDEPAGGALANLLHYPDLGALTLTANLSGQRSAEHVEVSAHAGQLQAHAAGSLDLNRESADVSYSLNASAMAPRPDLSWQRIALQGRWQGTLSAPHASGHLEVVSLQSSGGMGLAMFNADLNADGGDLALHATAEGLVLPGPQPRLLADSPVRIDAMANLKDAARPLEVSADHKLFLLQARANTAGAPSATFELRLRDLAPLAAIAHQSIRGTSEIKGTVKQSSATTRLDLGGAHRCGTGGTVAGEAPGRRIASAARGRHDGARRERGASGAECTRAIAVRGRQPRSAARQAQRLHCNHCARTTRST